jgi:hypothetical protein
MNYVLVENKQAILWGPLNWRYRFLQSELSDMEVEYTLSPTEPSSYLKINDSLEIYPVSGLDIPQHDSTYEQLAGPFWQFNDDIAYGYYNVTSIPLNAIKNSLIASAANERYKKETTNLSFSAQSTTFTVDTNRNTRNLYVQKLITMTEQESVQWKFPEGWFTLSKQELNDIVIAINNHVQAQFDWELSIVNQINLAQNVNDLKNIVIVEPTSVSTE